MKRPRTMVEMALWPAEILRLEEVRDEINKLSAHLLSKDNLEDRLC